MEPVRKATTCDVLNVQSLLNNLPLRYNFELLPLRVSTNLSSWCVHGHFVQAKGEGQAA